MKIKPKAKFEKLSRGVTSGNLKKNCGSTLWGQAQFDRGTDESVVRFGGRARKFSSMKNQLHGKDLAARHECDEVRFWAKLLVRATVRS